MEVWGDGRAKVFGAPIDDNDVIRKVDIATINGNSITNGGNIEIDSIEVDNELSVESENPVQNKVVTEALDGKLDKQKWTGAGNTFRIYGINYKGEQVLLKATNYNLATWETIPMRSSQGALRIPDWKGGGAQTNGGAFPDGELAVNKNFVDNAINSVKPYTHIVTITNESGTIDITLTILSYDNTPFDTASIYNGIMLGCTNVPLYFFELFKSIITIYAEGTGYGNNIEKPNYSLWKDANLINIDTSETLDNDGNGLTVTDTIV
jgi:hypothetical protein